MDTAPIHNYIIHLPENIQNAINTFTWTPVCNSIGEKFQLHIDQLETFKKETLFVAVGAKPAKDYRDNLALSLGISKNIAQKIVEESNISIFSELQKNAFPRKEDSEKITHQDLADEGIVLIDNKDTKPNNKLQQIGDSIINGMYIPKYKQTPKIKEQKIIPTKKQYNEPIELSDLAGITKHRTPYTYHETKKASVKNLSKNIFEQTYISKGDIFDASPSTQEQIKEEGNFLKHISKIQKIIKEKNIN